MTDQPGGPTDPRQQPEQPSGQFQPLQPGAVPADPAYPPPPQPQARVQYGPPAAKRKRNPTVIWLSVVAGLLAIALIVVIGLLAFGSGGAPSAGPSASASATSTPTPSASGPPATSAPTQAPPVRPADCAALFPPGYIDSLTDGGILALNPSWTDDTIDTEFIGSNDGVLQDFLAMSEDRLNCALVKASGGGDLGIITNVAWVDADRQSAAIARMNEAGFTCSEESGGTMCFTESSTDAGDSGERHFLRDGTWVATRWANTAITGWTQTIVATLFPA
ncbi:hypothetical protein KXS11_00870 [Plantibacter flavus]|uniref:hypothetical protein n=1 Tax=Plantibacter flavus TaxID=150123 RepID=UPI003F1672F4